MGGFNKCKKKFAALFLCFVVVLGIVGCGPKKAQTDTPSAAGEKEGKTNNTQPAKEEKVSLDVWHLWTIENDGNAVSFNRALEQYQAEHPNVTINIDATENEAYKTKIKTAISANEAPDVFFTWGAGFAKPFVDAGQVAKITDYLDEAALKNLQMASANNFMYDGALYGLPYSSWVGVLYCNEEMFNEAGVKIPETYDELMTAIEVFNGKGIVPITVGAKDAWNAMFFQNIASIRTAGTELSTQALMKEASYDQQAFADGAQMVLDLVEADAFDPSCLAFSYDEAKIALLNGECPMMYQGSWLAAEIQNEEISLVKDKVVAVNFPALEGSAYNNQFLGGAIEGLVVSEKCEHKKVAAEFVAYITEAMAKESFLQGSGIPVWDIDAGDASVDPLVQQIVDLAYGSDGYVVAWDTFLSGADVTTHLSLVQDLFAQAKTADEFVKGMQALNE
ncbi:extracellular solute-binding protein [Vallitalea pronyensis]|uniref:Extracellular solute-binding protein n=1 Tax=Vallitalea pronyensis TaxID=1348613 RepID=A0A8J8MPT5_9FIRM|nr:extracellular solute-binding protein [Vallitalea pronyensis]QUI25384.1 extracellular solute-binding protein [Vallitalea pronyensis]